GENSQRFAEIIAGAVLAGEISLLASEGEGTLARAHKTLARGGK
ncbi:3-hydroxy-3-methylglutaryl-CoA reductase, partial [Candidatus Gottesmanbacteria bacterium]|nr:3-hydroxy-3-methylglutaryl-CoA reductase [Candidatus Gottesmanbacteria bacterium]